MPKATVTLANGTVVQIEGTTDDVKDLLAFYSGAQPRKVVNPKADSVTKKAPKSIPKEPTEGVPIHEIVKHVKDCDEADDIESRILDRTSQANRILLPLYILKKHMGSTRGLTTGDISSVLKDLGIPIHQANVSNALKGSAARYVIGDKVRKKGQPVYYTLSRRGLKYIENVIKGKSDGE